MVRQLARFIGIWPWPLFLVVLKAMSTIKGAVIDKPDFTVKKFCRDSTRLEEANNKMCCKGTRLTKLEPVMEDWEHELNVEEYKMKQNIFREQEATWKENT